MIHWQGNTNSAVGTSWNNIYKKKLILQQITFLLTWIMSTLPNHIMWSRISQMALKPWADTPNKRIKWWGVESASSAFWLSSRQLPIRNTAQFQAASYVFKVRYNGKSAYIFKNKSILSWTNLHFLDKAKAASSLCNFSSSLLWPVCCDRYHKANLDPYCTVLQNKSAANIYSITWDY